MQVKREPVRLDNRSRRHTLFAMKLALVLCLLPLPLWAACPPLPDASDQRAALHTDLLNAGSEAEAAQIAAALWKIWLTAPDAQAQDLLDRSMQKREAWDLAGSEALQDQLITYCPDYAEAYNQRAFTRFMREDYEGALIDIDRVLEGNPYHFGALSGRALVLIQMGRAEAAQRALREAVAVHPFLRERAMINDDI